MANIKQLIESFQTVTEPEREGEGEGEKKTNYGLDELLCSGFEMFGERSCANRKCKFSIVSQHINWF